MELLNKIGLQEFLNNIEFLKLKFMGNALSRYLLALFVLLASVFIIKILKIVISRKISKAVEKTTTRFDDILLDFFNSDLIPVLYYGALYIATFQLKLTDGIAKLVKAGGVIFIAIQATRVALKFLRFVLEEKVIPKNENFNATTSNGIMLFLKMIFWGLCGIFILDNLGFDISAVVAGLGIGGVAIALASQNILNDLFNYFVIFFDRPFESGDFVVIGDFLGVIKHIGIKTTRITSLSGEELVFSNSDLTGSRLRNYRKMEKRRVVFDLGVTYDTPNEKLSLIPGIVKDIIEKIEDAVFDRCHFKTFKDFSLHIETVYYVIGNDFTKYMNIQQKINLEVKERFENEGIEFAFPTQTLHVSQESGVVGQKSSEK
ncbi:MAG: mechanosensitive ion channel family protein [Candidatus Muiribacteriaceae bacterium]